MFPFDVIEPIINGNSKSSFIKHQARTGNGGVKFSELSFDRILKKKE